MKKFLALVLAMLMVACTVSALAAKSPENPGGKVNPTVTTDDEETEVELSEVTDTEETKEIKDLLTEAETSGNVLSVLPEDVQAVIPEEYTKVSEMITATIPAGKDASNGLTLEMKCQTPYQKGSTIYVVIGVPGKDGEIEWIAVKGTVIDEGKISFDVSEEIYNKIAGKTVVVVPVSK